MFEKFRKNNLSNEKIEELVNEAEMVDEEAFQQHEKHYSEEGLWNKIKKYSKKAGSSVIYAVLLLYYVMKKAEVPKKEKTLILGALGYFILPLDLIPDIAPGVGYVDDLGALIAALVRVSMYIDADIKKQAKDKIQDWFGDVDTSDIDDRLI
ncbi:DUF1232 domain-containing protein [Rummeliibacillus sp. TYF005]|nr:DUF1232 domain-containing protein [Rummeliibacillus sp. TYF005]